MEKEERAIKIERTAFFAGKRKVGLDTNILIKLYENPYLLSYEEARIFNYKDAVFIHPISLSEFLRYLAKKEFAESEAETKAKEFLFKHNIKIISCFIPEKDILKFEQECNRNFEENGKDYLKCHRPDSIILLAFKKCSINKIISTDISFRECASFLKIDSSGLPSLDAAMSRTMDHKAILVLEHPKNCLFLLAN